MHRDKKVTLYRGCLNSKHDDVIKWKHFPRYWPFMRGIYRSPVNSPHEGQWRGALMFSLIYVWINGWVNNRKAGDLRRYCVHYDVFVMRTVVNHCSFFESTPKLQWGHVLYLPTTFRYIYIYIIVDVSVPFKRITRLYSKLVYFLLIIWLCMPCLSSFVVRSQVDWPSCTRSVIIFDKLYSLMRSE